MKTIIKKLATLSALAIMVVGCQKDVIEDSMIIPSGGILVESPSKGVSTRVAENPNSDDALGYKVSWEVGDKLYVSDGDGSSLIGVYEVKTAANINTDGSAIFQAKEGNTPLLDADTKYQFLATDAEIDKSYSDYIAATRESFQEYSADVTDANNLVTSLLYSKEALTVGSGLSLSHFFSYVRVGAKIADATKPKAKFSYVDNEGVSYTQTLNLDKFDESLIEDDTYTFNITIIPATILEANPIRLEVSADGESYTTQKELAKDTKFVEGVHYDFNDSDDMFAPANNEIIVDGEAKPIVGNYSEFMGDWYGCRLSSSHSDQRLSYPFNPIEDYIHFTDYKEYMFEMSVIGEYSGYIDLDLANPDFSPYDDYMVIESTIAGKSNGDAVEGVDLVIAKDGSQVLATYVPNLRDPDYLNCKYNGDNTFQPIPVEIISGHIKSGLIEVMPYVTVFVCDVTLTVGVDIDGVFEQKTFTVTSNGEYEKEPIDESKFNNTITLGDVTKDITATLKVSKGDAEPSGNPYVVYSFSAEHTPKQLVEVYDQYFNVYDSDEPKPPFVHQIFTNVPSVSIDSSDPSSYEMLGYSNPVEVFIKDTGDMGIENILLSIQEGEIIAYFDGKYSGGPTATINKYILEYNLGGDKVSYKLDLDMTININETEYDQIVKAEYAGPMAGVPVEGVNFTESEMIIIDGKSEGEFDNPLYCDVLPFEAQNKKVTITSSNESVATIEKVSEPWGDSYFVVPHKVGTAVITAKTEEGGYEAYCNVTVSPSLIDVTPHEVTIDTEGGSFTVEITTDEDWTVDSGWNFVDYDQRSGSGDATITVNIPESVSSYEKTTYVKIKTTGDIYDYDMVWVKQPAADE